MIVLLLALLAAAAPPQKAVPATLTNEDIVRLVVNGTAEKVILDEIVARPVDFDLSPGVVDELARVGVSPKIIDAMRRRQAEVAPPPPPSARVPEPSAEAEPEQGLLALRFADPADPKKPDAVLAIASLPKGAPRPGDAEIGAVSELAVAILCSTTDHVPDHWEMKTPLSGAPRHEMLLFRPGSEPRREKGFDVIALLRDPIPAFAVPAGRHSIIVGLAGKQTGSGSWRLLASDVLKTEIQPGRTTNLVLEARTGLTGSRMLGFRYDQVWKLRQDPPPSESAPAQSGSGSGPAESRPRKNPL
jgi:hypothetical protein